MSYINRLFFRKDTGALVHRYIMMGDVPISTVEQDLEIFQPLKSYSLDSVAIKEVDKSDVETIDKLLRCSSVNLDLVTNELVFSFTVEVQEQLTQQQILNSRVADLEMALATIMGV